MTDTVARSSFSTGTLRRLFGTVHLWIGVIIGIPAAVLGVTGIALMIVHPLPATIGADTGAATVNIDNVIANARAAVTGDAAPQQYDAPVGHQSAAVRFRVSRSDDNPRGLARILIDPATMAVMDDPQQQGGIRRLIHDLHGSFMAGGDGRAWVGWVGRAMCVLALTGIVLWWPKRGQWRAAFTISGRGNTLMVLREIHGAAGIWGLAVFFIISLTGTVIAFPPDGGPAAGDSRPMRSDDHALVELHVDQAVAQAMTAVPNTVLRSVTLPANADDTYRVALARAGDDRAAPPTVVTVDGTASKVTDIRDPDQIPAGAQFLLWNRPLHTGMGLGWTWWILTLLSGALPVIFAGSGIAMWLIKRRNRHRVLQQTP